MLAKNFQRLVATAKKGDPSALRDLAKLLELNAVSLSSIDLETRKLIENQGSLNGSAQVKLSTSIQGDIRTQQLSSLLTNARQGNDEALCDLAAILENRGLELLGYGHEIARLIISSADAPNISTQTKRRLSTLKDVPVYAFEVEVFSSDDAEWPSHETRYLTLKQYMLENTIKKK